MLTNARWLLTTVLRTLIVQMLWDHFTAIANLDIVVMVKLVKVLVVQFSSIAKCCIHKSNSSNIYHSLYLRDLTSSFWLH